MLALDIARGLISNELGDIATSATKSSKWLLGGIFSGKFRARSRYLRAVGKLGLSYWHIQRATAAQGQTGSFQQNPLLREEVLRWRDKV
jgi:protease PrsW